MYGWLQRVRDLQIPKRKNLFIRDRNFETFGIRYNNNNNNNSVSISEMYTWLIFMAVTHLNWIGSVTNKNKIKSDMITIKIMFENCSMRNCFRNFK